MFAAGLTAAKIFFCQEDLVSFLKWMDSEFPQEDGVRGPQNGHRRLCGFQSIEFCFPRTYAKAVDLSRQGAVLLRPWHLPFTPESGVKGLLEQDFKTSLGGGHHVMFMNIFLFAGPISSPVATRASTRVLGLVSLLMFFLVAIEITFTSNLPGI